MAVVITDVSEGRIISIIRMTRIIEFLHSMLRLLVTANVPRLPTLVALMMEAVYSSKTSVLTRTAWRNIQEDGIVQKSICLYLLLIL
jgi:hypothetical protein